MELVERVFSDERLKSHMEISHGSDEYNYCVMYLEYQMSNIFAH